ncbi:MAG: aminomethyl-transferring glycine dehydrogenase [Oligoflexales bacterium]|nr:aminomethyl-transferring glycine dehydrogenase [Oligoflexales bacterium]
MTLLMNGTWKEQFASRHIGPDVGEQKRMLDALGVGSLDELTESAVPEPIKLNQALALDPEMSEVEALKELRQLAQKNKMYKNWIGMGYGNAVTPAVIQRNILENPGWYTQYTPYQPEISQGRLESLLNFQTMVADLTGLPVANASLLDEATAAAEAMSMSHSLNNTDGSKGYFISSKCHPQVIEVVKGRAEALGLDVIVGDHQVFQFDSAFFGVLLSYPNTEGSIEDYQEFIKRAHEQDALVCMCCDIFALALLTPPGELGADIAVGNTQKFGVPLGYGGPHAAFFATRDEFKRKVPGRIVGVSKDASGKLAYRLALQTREQHIRREKATSNICTAQALLANMASMYAVYHGKEGITSIANRIHALSSLLAAGLTEMGYRLKHSAFFDTVFLSLDAQDSKDLYQKALSQGINLRNIEGGGISVSFDESTDLAAVEELLSIFKKSESKAIDLKQLAKTSPQHIPEFAVRTSSFLEHPVFKSYRSETELMRYIKRLEQRDLSLTTAMIPLGSCTMKLNAACELAPISWPEFSQLHPFAPKDQTLGYQELCSDLEKMLAEVTGFDAVSLQPNSGAQGEYAGLLVIKAHLKESGQGHRNICLIPKSAHGTNPASAQLAGFKVVGVKCDDSGNIDLADLKQKAGHYKENLGAIMVTYPSTHGVFEESIKDVCKVIHDHGGQVYLDGANLNAQLCLCAPGQFGADVCHLNLHKTFAIPHGGGGPGMGPIAVKSHLSQYLPSHPVHKTGGAKGISPVSSAPYGSAGILPISWMYLKLLGPKGLKQASQVAILSANYIAKKLEQAYPILYRAENGLVAHECIIDIRPFKASAGIEVVDIAKRLMDYNFHAPTMAFPVAGTLMIEPTESEGLAEIDRFCEAMLKIRDEIKQIESGAWTKQDNPLKNAPHTVQSLCQEWDKPYSRTEACFPTASQSQQKFWPFVSRVDEAFGDRNFMCTCGSVDHNEG